MAIKDAGKTLDKVIITDKPKRKINPVELAKKLGARIVSVPELTPKEVESNHYVLLGSPVTVSSPDKNYVYYFGSKMLNQQGLSLDDVVGYVISYCVSAEEPDLQNLLKECGSQQAVIVRYYGKKEKRDQ